jgi:hypothetical protein
MGCALLVTAACGDDGASSGDDSGGDDGGDDDASVGARPHPLYPPLDLDTLPGSGGAASGPYEPPMLPATTRTVTAMNGAEVSTACQTPGTAVTVPDSAGNIGNLDIGDAEDCDITLGANVVSTLFYLGHFPGPVIAPSHRIRVRGGQIHHVMVDPGSTDVVLDGVVINNGVVPPAGRNGAAIYLPENVNRFAVVNSIIRLLPVTSGADIDGCAYLAGSSNNIFFANNNIVTAGNRNSWGFRISGGDNFIVVDNTIRVSFHKLIRMNDGPVDYVYVKGGTWMREDTVTSGGLLINDSFQQLGDLGTDKVFIHDTSVHLESMETVGFGATAGPGQAGKSWEARRIHWYAANANVVSDTSLMANQSSCVAGATCDYGVGTHMYTYGSPPVLPDGEWRSLPGIAVDNPDDQPVAQ